MGVFSGSIGDGLFGGAGAARDAARLQSDAAGAGIEEQRRQFDLIQQMLNPSITAGDTARQQQMALLGLLGPEAQAAAQAALQESPGQKFMRDRQERALTRNAAATGGLGGGNIQTALQEQAAGFAQQDLQNQFGRLGALSGAGNQAVGQFGQFGTQAAGNIANLLGQQGQAQASGVLGSQAAHAQQVNQLMQIGAMFSDSQLKHNIKKVGKYGPLNVYSWDWNISNDQDFGFIAQEVKEIFPKLVKKIHGFLAVDYENVIKEIKQWA